jgi:hypothetical protein
MNNFQRIASLHPHSISCWFAAEYDTPELNAIWSRISLHQLWLVHSDHDPYPIFTTQTGLTSLTLGMFTRHIQHCTNLLELTTPLPTISDYKYIPSSLTTLTLRAYVQWSFDDDNISMITNHLPHLSSLKLERMSSLMGGGISSLSRLLSLTKLSISTAYGIELPSLNGLIHSGSLRSPNHEQLELEIK